MDFHALLCQPLAQHSRLQRQPGQTVSPALDLVFLFFHEAPVSLGLNPCLLDLSHATWLLALAHHLLLPAQVRTLDAVLNSRSVFSSSLSSSLRPKHHGMASGLSHFWGVHDEDFPAWVTVALANPYNKPLLNLKLCSGSSASSTSSLHLLLLLLLRYLWQRRWSTSFRVIPISSSR